MIPVNEGFLYLQHCPSCTFVYAEGTNIVRDPETRKYKLSYGTIYEV